MTFIISADRPGKIGTFQALWCFFKAETGIEFKLKAEKSCSELGLILFISQMCGREWYLWSPCGGALLGSGAGEVLAKGTVIASVPILPMAS